MNYLINDNDKTTKFAKIHIDNNYFFIGHTHLPPIPGHHELTIDLFRPKSSTLLGEISCYLGGKRPEFLDFKIVAEGEGRDVLRFSSEKGQVVVKIDVIIKDLAKHGYAYN